MQENSKVCVIGIWHLGSVVSACLADLGYLCQEYHGESYEDEGLTKVDFATSGIPTEAEYIRQYEERTGRRITGDWNFYLAYNMFRIAGILQGIMKRVVDGTASSAQAMEAGKRARPMAELGWKYAQQAGA